jgi:dTDP-4-dehydrorhamnose reductase
MRILITGAGGQLGTALQEALSAHHLVLKDLPDFDLADPACERQVIEARPEVILHAGAFTDVDGAEQNPEQAHAVNVQGTMAMARAADTLKARLIYLSTDYVFDGAKSSPYTEEDATNPVNTYGRSKREGEKAALSLCRNALVVRTAWLYGDAGRNFVKTIVRLAGEKPYLEVVNDQRGCPTYATDLAQALRDLVELDVTGICHVTNSGSCTWHEFAETIVRLARLSTEVRPITTAQAGRLARRPPYSVLASARLESLRRPLPHWHDALGRCLERINRVAPAVQT